LRTSGFWTLIPNPGFTEVLNVHGGSLPTLTAFQTMVKGAELDNDLILALSDPDNRRDIRALLIDRYFSGSAGTTRQHR
jgi:hypothetical protein